MMGWDKFLFNNNLYALNSGYFCTKAIFHITLNTIFFKSSKVAVSQSTILFYRFV